MLIATVACRIANKIAWLQPPSVLLASAEVASHQSVSLHSQGTQQLITSRTKTSPQPENRVPVGLGAADELPASISTCTCRPCSRPGSFTTAAASWAAGGSTGGVAGSGAGAATQRTAETGSQLQQPLELSKQALQGRSARSITLDIKGCSTTQQLQQLVQQDGQNMNYINLSAAVVKLQKLLCNNTVQQQQPVQETRLFDELWQLQQPNLSKCGARELSNMIYSVCLLPKLLLQHDQCVLAQHLLPAFVRQVSSTNSQDVSNVLYGLAASGQHSSQQSTELLVGRLVAILPDANIQSIANTVWAVATMSQQIQPMQLQQLLEAFCAVARKAKPQEIKDTLWAVATMQQQVQPTQLQQLLDAFCAVAQEAKPQHIAITLWAVATMKQSVQPTKLQQLLEVFCAVAHKAKPQAIANTLWAVAKMEPQVVPAPGQLEQLVCAFVMQLSEAVPQSVSNTLSVCSNFRYLPNNLLTAPGLIDKVATSEPQVVANIAWACGQLGHRDEHLMSALLHRVLDLVGSSKMHLISSGVNAQTLANLCWSLAVLDLREHAPTVLTLVQAGKPLWASMVPENLSQLYQVHMWLTDHSLVGGQGLAGVLTTQELQQCQSTWQDRLYKQANMDVTNFQQSVFDAFQRIPMKWLVPPAVEQVSLGADGQPDGAALIDITARTADGVWLAVEADGPTHFRRPDRGLVGPTLYRNRALAVRGYVVISVPHYEWDTQHSGKLKQQYLQNKVKAALLQAPVNRLHLPFKEGAQPQGAPLQHR